MRTLLAAAIGMAALAMSPTSALAHHNIQHSIVVQQNAPCAPSRARPNAKDLSIQFATGQPNPVIRARSDRQQAAGAGDAQLCEGTGEITAVTATTVTIHHGPIVSRHWPAMTMTFAAADPRSLKGLAVGDHVGFDVKDGTDTPTINRIMKR